MYQVLAKKLYRSVVLKLFHVRIIWEQLLRILNHRLYFLQLIQKLGYQQLSPDESNVQPSWVSTVIIDKSASF